MEPVLGVSMERTRTTNRDIKRSVVTWGFCVGNSMIAVAILLLVFFALPVRWWPVDLPAIALATLLGLSAFALATRTPWQRILLKISALICLLVGMLVVAAASLSVAFLSGTHGDLGKNGMLIMAVAIGLIVPYLIIYPCAQLLWIHRLSHDKETP